MTILLTDKKNSPARKTIAFFPWEDHFIHELEGIQGPNLASVLNALPPDDLKTEYEKLGISKTILFAMQLARQEDLKLFDAIVKSGTIPPVIEIFCRDIFAFRWSKWSDLELSLTKHPPQSGPIPWISSERLLLGFFVQSRKSGLTPHSLSTTSEHKSQNDWDRKLNPWIEQILAYDEISKRVGYGFYKEHLYPLRSLLRYFQKVSIYWTLRVEQTFTTIYQASGAFVECTFSQKKIAAMLKNYPSIPIQVSYLRRELSLAIESERFEDAHNLLPVALEAAEKSQHSWEKALILQEKFRIQIFENDEPKIKSTLKELETYVEESKLSVQFLTLIEERCELAIRNHDGQTALNFIRERVAQTKARGELSGICVALMYEGRALLELGKFEEAQSVCLESLELAKAQGYGKCIVTLYFYLSTIEMRLGRPSEARQSLVQAGFFAKERRLPTQVLCCEIAMDFVFENRFSLLPFFNALPFKSVFVEVFYYLKCYGFFEKKQVRISIGEKCVELQPLELFLTSVRRHRGLLWCPAELFVCALSDSKITTMPLDLALDTDLVTKILLESGEDGIKIENFHALLYPTVQYRPDTHGPRVRMLMTRTRKKLEPLELKLIYHEKSKIYRLKHAVGIFQIHSLNPKTKMTENFHSFLPREIEILSSLKREGPSGITRIQEIIGISRQSLNPWIRTLINKKAIISVGKTRNLVYALNNNSELLDLLT